MSGSKWSRKSGNARKIAGANPRNQPNGLDVIKSAGVLRIASKGGARPQRTTRRPSRSSPSGDGQGASRASPFVRNGATVTKTRRYQRNQRWLSWTNLVNGPKILSAIPPPGGPNGGPP